MKKVFAKRFIFSVLVGAILLVFFGFALFSKGESGNSGMSLKLQKFIPFFAFIVLEVFLFIQALYFFANRRMSDGLQNTYATILLGALIFIMIYIEHNLY